MGQNYVTVSSCNDDNLRIICVPFVIKVAMGVGMVAFGVFSRLKFGLVFCHLCYLLAPVFIMPEES